MVYFVVDVGFLQDTKKKVKSSFGLFDLEIIVEASGVVKVHFISQSKAAARGAGGCWE